MLLAWEGVNGILPHVLQKLSVLYYLQSLCPVPAPMDGDTPMLVRMLPALASRPALIPNPPSGRLCTRSCGSRRRG